MYIAEMAPNHQVTSAAEFCFKYGDQSLKLELPLIEAQRVGDTLPPYPESIHKVNEPIQTTAWFKEIEASKLLNELPKQCK